MTGKTNNTIDKRTNRKAENTVTKNTLKKTQDATYAVC